MNENLVIVMIVTFTFAAIGKYFYNRINKKNSSNCGSCSCSGSQNSCK